MNDRNLNEYEKMDAVKRKAEQLEQQAQMQEKLMQVNKAGGGDPGNPDSVK